MLQRRCTAPADCSFARCYCGLPAATPIQARPPRSLGSRPPRPPLPAAASCGRRASRLSLVTRQTPRWQTRWEAALSGCSWPGPGWTQRTVVCSRAARLPARSPPPPPLAATAPTPMKRKRCFPSTPHVAAGVRSQAGHSLHRAFWRERAGGWGGQGEGPRCRHRGGRASGGRLGRARGAWPGAGWARLGPARAGMLGRRAHSVAGAPPAAPVLHPLPRTPAPLAQAQLVPRLRELVATKADRRIVYQPKEEGASS